MKRIRDHAAWAGNRARSRSLHSEGLYKLSRHAPMQHGQEIGHAPANLAFVAVLTSSFALLAFSKY